MFNNFSKLVEGLLHRVCKDTKNGHLQLHVILFLEKNILFVGIVFLEGTKNWLVGILFDKSTPSSAEWWKLLPLKILKIIEIFSMKTTIFTINLFIYQFFLSWQCPGLWSVFVDDPVVFSNVFKSFYFCGIIFWEKIAFRLNFTVNYFKIELLLHCF